MAVTHLILVLMFLQSFSMLPVARGYRGIASVARGWRVRRRRVLGDRLILMFDGCSRGNPGPGGAGAVLLQEKQGGELTELWAGSVFLGGRVTNNQAEYAGLKLGLQHVVNHTSSSESSTLLVQGDSLLVVKQLQGTYRVRSPNISGLYREVTSLLQGLKSKPIFQHIPRALNSRADELSNLAVDGANSTTASNSSSSSTASSSSRSKATEATTARAKALRLNNISRHIFLCADQSKPKCCSRELGMESWEFLKQRSRELSLERPSLGLARSKVNCLQVCVNGPIAVVYGGGEPQGVWYHSCTPAVLERILQEHVINGIIVKEYQFAGQGCELTLPENNFDN